MLKRSVDVIAQRWARGQRTRIIYVGDFDPAGMDMSDHLHERLVEVHAPAKAFEVERVALTQELLTTWQLQPHKPKKKDKRTPTFIKRYGVACVEVEALPPDVLAQVVEDAIRACIEEPARWLAEREREEYECLILRTYAEHHGPRLDALVIERMNDDPA